jgi:uncharacterized membrane protein YqjE
MLPESIGDMLGGLATNVAGLIHNEIELVKQQVREKITEATGDIIMIAIGAAFGLVGLMALCAALVIALTSYMTLGIAALVTGGGLALLAIITAFIGITNLKKKKVQTLR